MTPSPSSLKKTLSLLTALIQRELQLDVGPVYIREGAAVASWSSLADKKKLYIFLRLSLDDQQRGVLNVGVTRGSASSRAVRSALRSQVTNTLEALDQLAHRVQVTLSPHEYGVITTLNVNLNRHERSWDKAIALVSLCTKIERAVVQSLDGVNEEV